MNIRIEQNTDIFILGAGASVDYGLPVWKDLVSLIRKRLKDDDSGKYVHKKEISEWLSKVGTDYETIDKCMEVESVQPAYHTNGHSIEDELFSLIKESFSDVYRIPKDGGWIRKFGDKILRNSATYTPDRIFFVNYNYEDVFEKNFLNFDHFGSKNKHRFNQALDMLTRTKIKILCPHGSFYTPDKTVSGSRVEKYIDTHKNAASVYKNNAISCHESNRNLLYKDNRLFQTKLYILGLGGGLRLNLSNLLINTIVSEIHITINDSLLKHDIVAFLMRHYSIPENKILIYSSCDELIEKCF